ncbi:MAG: hypothetical protein C4294_11615, partial [Nitrospiraceae bacterium]
HRNRSAGGPIQSTVRACAGGCIESYACRLIMRQRSPLSSGRVSTAETALLGSLRVSFLKETPMSRRATPAIRSLGLVLLYLVCWAGVEVGAQEPGAKPPEQKTPQPKSPEHKTPEQKSQEPKPPAPPVPKQEKPQETKPPEPTGKPVKSPILTVKLALMADPRLFSYDINVEMSGDTAVLSGKVSTEAEKTAAAEVAQGVDGVKAVTNHLEVVKDLSRALAKRKDEIITQYVKERFARSKTLESVNFDVKTEDGIVHLSGKTRFQVIVLEAAEAARQVPGVKAVRTEGVHLEGS